jgi:hypothetical protein
VYEIIRAEDGYALNQTEMEELVKGTGIELVDLLYSGPANQDVITDIMAREPSTVLGGEFEGIVVKRMTSQPYYRRKIVSPRFRESREPEVPDDRDVASLGRMYNVPARIAKAQQRRRERDTSVDISTDLDNDLMQEHGAAIKDALFCLMFKRMANGARAAYLGQALPEDYPEALGYKHAPLREVGGGPGGQRVDPKAIQKFLEMTRNYFATQAGQSLRDELWTYYSSVILDASRPKEIA